MKTIVVLFLVVLFCHEDLIAQGVMGNSESSNENLTAFAGAPLFSVPPSVPDDPINAKSPGSQLSHRYVIKVQHQSVKLMVFSPTTVPVTLLIRKCNGEVIEQQESVTNKKIVLPTEGLQWGKYELQILINGKLKRTLTLCKGY